MEDMEQKGTLGGNTMSEMEIDAVGEILNISMGSSATAVSELLSAKVWITTPKVAVKKVKELEYHKLEPAMCVKITYLKGVSGTNIMVLKQDDVQLILNQLMGLPLVVTDDFVFDELNISAVCEVMNQMMGASATALSDFLGETIDISTPTAYVLEGTSLYETAGMNEDEYVAAVTFHLSIDNVINSEFISVMNLDLAKELANRMLNDISKSEPAPQAAPSPAPQAQAPAAAQPQMAPPMQQMPGQQQMPAQQQMPGQYPPQYPPQYAAQYPPQYAPPYPYEAYPAGAPYPPQYPPQYPPYPSPAQQAPNRAQVNVQNVQLHTFESFDTPNPLSEEQQDNLKLLMGVPLNVTVEIGSAKKRVKEILEFSQGTIIELERQAGAPVDIIVNGHLIARGDVVVIDDNFAVRITDIIKSKFLDALGSKE